MWLFCRQAGKRTHLQYRNRDKIKRRLKIGVHGAVTTEEARTRAKTYLLRVFQGKDPLDERQIKQKEPILEDLILKCKKRFVETKRLKTLNNENHILEKYVIQSFAGRKICSIKTHDIEGLHYKLKDTPYQANRVLSLLSEPSSRGQCYLGMGLKKTLCRAPARYGEPKRDRPLNQEEVSLLWKALDEYPRSLSRVCF